jgi:hypothetical protein
VWQKKYLIALPAVLIQYNLITKQAKEGKIVGHIVKDHR